MCFCVYISRLEQCVTCNASKRLRVSRGYHQIALNYWPLYCFLSLLPSSDASFNRSVSFLMRCSSPSPFPFSPTLNFTYILLRVIHFHLKRSSPLFTYISTRVISWFLLLSYLLHNTKTRRLEAGYFFGVTNDFSLWLESVDLYCTFRYKYTVNYKSTQSGINETSNLKLNAKWRIANEGLIVLNLPSQNPIKNSRCWFSAMLNRCIMRNGQLKCIELFFIQSKKIYHEVYNFVFMH